MMQSVTHEEYIRHARAATQFLPDHYPRTVADRTLEIAQSPYAELPPDRYGQGGFIAQLEQEVAELLGKESAVFMPSGTMAQQIALRIWCDWAGKPRVAFHATCHLQIHEQMAYHELHHLDADLLGEPHRLFTTADLKRLTNLPAALLVELPQREMGGQLPTWDELCRVTEFAKENGIKLHLDGARLWETQPFYGISYSEIVRAFDSVYVSFYKILGGLAGAMLAGPADLVKEARVWQRRHGGNLVHLFPNAISARIGMDKHLPRIPEYVAKAKEVASILHRLQGVEVVPAEPQTNMMHLYFESSSERLRDAIGEISRREGVYLMHYGSDTAQGAKVELSLGSAGLDIPQDRLRTLLEELVHTACKVGVEA